MNVLFRRAVVCLTLMFFVATGIEADAQTTQRNTGATSTQNIDSKKLREASKESREAASAFTKILEAPDGGIPKDLLDRAEAVAVFPGVVRAAFIVGGRGGDGVISRRTASGWSAPAFFKLGGGSFGAQIGASKSDIVLLFLNEGGLKGLLEDKLEIGGELGVVAGPVGRTPGASTNLTADAAIISYARSKGAYIGAALKGVVINPDNNLNEAIYGGKKAADILGEAGMSATMTAPTGVNAFTDTLKRYSARR